MFSLAINDRISTLPIAEVIDSANSVNIHTLIQNYILWHVVPGAIGLRYARCQG